MEGLMERTMSDRLPTFFTAVIFLFIQFAALFLAVLFPSEYGAFEDAENPVNPLIYVVMILAVTGIILLLVKQGKKRTIQVFILFSIFVTLFIIFLPLFYMVVLSPTLAAVGALSVAVIMIAALLIRPEWYVIDIVGIAVASGITAILGMSLGILPAIIFLMILAVYDAISVYKTRHMLALADGVTSLGLPVLFVVPKRTGFKMESLRGRSITSDFED